MGVGLNTSYYSSRVETLQMEQIRGSLPALVFTGTIVLTLLYKIILKSKPGVEISELWIYPIKSCKGIKVNSALVTPRGFELDRWFMVVDQNGKFVSQRTFPQMALVSVTILDLPGMNMFMLPRRCTPQVTTLLHAGSGKVLCVDAPGMETLIVPTKPTTSSEATTVTVWGDECQAVVVDNEWFVKFLQVPGMRLVRIKEDFVRKTSPEYAPNGQTGFADGFPFLLATQESIAHINAKLSEPISNVRFRPNIVVRGAEPFAEDRWELLRFNDTARVSGTKDSSASLDVSVVKPCARCTIPNVNPETGVPSEQREPSRSMRGFRTGESIGLTNPKWQKEVSCVVHVALHGAWKLGLFGLCVAQWYC
jgi:uncharacterized protein YcbX